MGSLQHSSPLQHSPPPHLHKAVHAAGDQQLAVGREGGALGVRLGAELDLAVEVCGEGLHLVPRPRRRAAEQVKGGTRREQALLLLPVGAGSEGVAGTAVSRRAEA